MYYNITHNIYYIIFIIFLYICNFYFTIFVFFCFVLLLQIMYGLFIVISTKVVSNNFQKPKKIQIFSLDLKPKTPSNGLHVHQKGVMQECQSHNTEFFSMYLFFFENISDNVSGNNNKYYFFSSKKMKWSAKKIVENR